MTKGKTQFDSSWHSRQCIVLC